MHDASRPALNSHYRPERVLSASHNRTRATMSGFDADRVYSVSVYQNAPSFSTESPSETEKLLLDFLLQYRLGGEFIYR